MSRFSRIFGVVPGLKGFLSPQHELTRGAVSNVEQYKKKADNLRNARRLIKEQRKQIKEQAEAMRHARQKLLNRRELLATKDREIFELKNELRIAKQQLENVTKGRAAPQSEVESKTGALPDFIIIGAERSGTTFLYQLLAQHPDVEQAVRKELNYFDKHFDKGIGWYRSQFPPRLKYEQRFITGEATPTYLFHPVAPERMAGVVPQARLIALLRNPVDRAYSHYHMMLRNTHLTLTFDEAIEAKDYRGRLLERGIYVDHLLRWSKYFNKEQVLVLKSEDFFERTLENLKLIQDFLGLPTWQPELSMLTERQNPYLQAYRHISYPPMNPVTRQRLETFFEPHNRRLYKYLDVDFGW
jgi:hypothetical protein